MTSKLLVSKHQQVQILEAASVLVQMNQDNMPGTVMNIAHDDENSSASPAASGSSDPIDPDDVSSRTSTPSQVELGSTIDFRKRLDSYSDYNARSYQSSSGFGTSIPEGHSASMYRQWSSSGLEHSDDEQYDPTKRGHTLVNGTFPMGSGIPPVPPVPAKYTKIDFSADVQMIDEDEDEGIFGMEQ